MKITFKGRACKRNRKKQKERGPLKGKIVGVYFEAELRQKIERISKKTKLSRNAVLRQMVQSYRG